MMQIFLHMQCRSLILGKVRATYIYFNKNKQSFGVIECLRFKRTVDYSLIEIVFRRVYSLNLILICAKLYLNYLIYLFKIKNY